MGGHAAGEIASQEAVDTIYGMVKRGHAALTTLTPPLDEGAARAACRLMESAVQAATYMVFSMAQIDLNKSGMGTTISALMVLGAYAAIAQVGDSRIYRVRGGKTEQITEDHTVVAMQVQKGLITPEEAKKSPVRNLITRAVGNHDYVEVDTGLVSLERGDRFLLCSDGLSGYLRDDDVATTIALGADAAVAAFIDLANTRGGHDNITAVVVEID
jgi:protein phosphatase